MKQILFLCTGNYYRSRFAEVLFNHLSTAADLAWHADSSGLRVQADGVVNHGPISHYAVEGLTTRSVPLPKSHRFPRQVTETELAASQLVIALKEAEHRPLMEKLHPDFSPRVRYWHVHDLDAAVPADALAELETLIRALIAECGR